MPNLPNELLIHREGGRSVVPASTARSVLADIGEDSVIDALELKVYTDAPDAPPSREAILLGLIRTGGRDLAHMTSELPMMMKSAGILLPEMLDLIRKKDIAIAMTNSGRHVGEVLDGLGEFGKPRWVICSTCDGEGEIVDADNPAGDPDEGEPTIAGTQPCTNPECQAGKVRQMGNLDAAKLFLSAQGLNPKGGGAQTINVGTQVGVKVEGGPASKPQQESVTTRVQQILEG